MATGFEQAAKDQQRKSEVSEVLDRNISALLKRREDDEKSLGLQERIAVAISRFAGSMNFVYLHILLFGSWIIINAGVLPIIKPFDESLVILAMTASVEAIFISTFVMINQNRMAEMADKRAELSLQISLLAEHETTTVIKLVSDLARHLEARVGVSEKELAELKRNVPPEAVLEEIERQSDP